MRRPRRRNERPRTRARAGRGPRPGGPARAPTVGARGDPHPGAGCEDEDGLDDHIQNLDLQDLAGQKPEEIEAALASGRRPISARPPRSLLDPVAPAQNAVFEISGMSTTNAASAKTCADLASDIAQKLSGLSKVEAP